ncbi:MAG: M28 family peptidase [Myxococcaceae bacterium]
MKLLRRVALTLGALVVLATLTAAWLIGQPFAGKSRSCGGVTADARRLEAGVRKIVTGFGARGEDQVEHLDAIAAHLTVELQLNGARVEQQPYDVKGRTYRNVIGRFGPAEGAPVVVGAHYDAYGNLPGADDNASGVAGVLELARLLGKEQPLFPVELVFYTLEEPPYFRTQQMGSAFHAESLRGKKIRGMIAVETIGYFSDEPQSQRLPLSLLEPFYPDQGNFIAVVGAIGRGGIVRAVKRGMSGASELPVSSLNGPAALRGVDFSDHLNYWARGHDAVMVTDTAFLRNRRYHTEQDTPDTLDYTRMAQVVSGVACAVKELE